MSDQFECEEGIRFPTFAELETSNPEIYKSSTYLFSIDEKRYYLAAELNLDTLEKFMLENIDIFRREAPRYCAFAGITGYQLYRWYESRRFCGKCGSRDPDRIKRERMLYCEKCGNMEYPKISGGYYRGDRRESDSYVEVCRENL